MSNPNDHPVNDRDSTEPHDASHADRSTSRDLDEIARRLAAGRSAQATPPDESRAEGQRARDAARIRSLMDRSATAQSSIRRAEPLPDLTSTTAALHNDAPDVRGDRAPEYQPAAMQFPRPDEVADLSRPIELPRRPGTARTLAITITAAVGLVIALGAYAGGAEYVSDLIDGTSMPAAAPVISSPVPVITDSAGSAADSIAYAEQLATFGELPGDTIRRAPFGTARLTAPSSRVAARRDSSRMESPNVGRTDGRLTARSTDKVAAVTTPSRPTRDTARSARVMSAPQSARRDGEFIVQVRATPDKAEAERLAARLRGRGARAVTVTTATKNGATLYRVRYGSFASQEEARQAARRDGHGDAWVARR
jgi:cell division septation protein DedD